MMVRFPWPPTPNSLSTKAPSFENYLFPAVIQVLFWRDPFFQPMPMVIFQVGIQGDSWGSSCYFLASLHLHLPWSFLTLAALFPAKNKGSVHLHEWVTFRGVLCLCLSSLSSTSILCTGIPLVPRMRLVILPHFDAKPAFIASSSSVSDVSEREIRRKKSDGFCALKHLKRRIKPLFERHGLTPALLCFFFRCSFFQLSPDVGRQIRSAGDGSFDSQGLDLSAMFFEPTNGDFHEGDPDWLIGLTYVLVGGWTNPCEKYARQIGFIFPNFRGEHEKIFELPPRSVG